MLPIQPWDCNAMSCVSSSDRIKAVTAAVVNVTSLLLVSYPAPSTRQPTIASEGDGGANRGPRAAPTRSRALARLWLRLHEPDEATLADLQDAACQLGRRILGGRVGDRLAIETDSPLAHHPASLRAAGD